MESVCKTVVLDDGEKVQFPRLWLEDLFSVADDLTAQREATARQLAKEEKLNRDETYNVVLDIRANKPSVHEMTVLCMAPQGASVVLRKSLTKAQKDQKEQNRILEKMVVPMCMDIAQLLLIDVQEEPPKEEEKKEADSKNVETAKEQVTVPSPTTPSTSEPSKADKIAELQSQAGQKVYGG